MVIEKCSCKFWESQSFYQVDPGAIPDKGSLLDGLFNDKGVLICSDREKITSIILEYRRSISKLNVSGFLQEEIVEMERKIQIFIDNKVTNAPSASCNEFFWDRDGGSQFDVYVTESEVRRALEKVKDVAAGRDQVPPISLKGHLKHEKGQCEIIAKFTAEFNAILMGAAIPDSWKQTRLVLIYKGHGDHPGCIDSYRGVGIGAASLKIFSLILEERLTEFMEQVITPYQMGFRRCSGTQEAALLLTITVKGTSANVLFVDIVKAYDSVVWPILIEKLINIGVSPMLVNFIRRLYQEQYQCVEVNGNVIGKVKMGQGLLQGSSLSPLLFNIYI